MLKERLGKELLFFDGGTGTLLQEKGLKPGELPETWNVEHAEDVVSIHRQYFEAGSDIVLANTFGANALKYTDSKYKLEEIITHAIENVKKASSLGVQDGRETYVALDVGPTGKLLKPMGDLSFDEAYDTFKEMMMIGEKAGADLIHIETMSDTYEVKAAVLAAKENTSLPVFVTMIFDEKGKLLTGGNVPAVVALLEGLHVDALGINCGLGPEQMLPILDEIMEYTSLPVIVKPNAGLPKQRGGEVYYDVEPEAFAGYMEEIVKRGAALIGGCCGTTPSHIEAMTDRLKKSSAFEERKRTGTTQKTIVCSYGNAVILGDRPVIIGERINPTGKKRFKQALIENDMDYILGQAIEQVEGGADILDVNVGLPEINEKNMMVKTVKALQSIVDVPLQIDSTKPEVLEAALRVYNGKPIVNSVNGEDKVLDTILPVVAKYGGAVIGLALDENGIPDSAEGRVEIAKKIMNRAMSYGIPKGDIIIDCLTLTVSAEQKAAGETLKALNIVKNELGLRTVLGVSNISFGLPNREIVNKTFLTMALYSGLDLPIINPNVASMVWAVKTYKVLAAIDENAMDFIEYSNNHPVEAAVIKSSVSENTPKASGNVSLGSKEADAILHAMETGMKSDGRNITKEVLTDKDPMEIINGMLIPALDVVGDKFEKGTIFLPQLILAADVAKECFEEIKYYLANNGEVSESKGKIIVATVKGDIHDIGKNIVKVILENYGFDVIDLGRDVDPMVVVDSAIENDVHLVGLSALMTTTLGSMEETIKLLREHNVDCKIMVGGAVLTEDYAMKIGADFYAKDAKMSADIAKQVLC